MVIDKELLVACFKSRVLDIFMFSSDVDASALDKIEKKALELGCDDWLRVEFPDYFA